jgi:hypothetical protein
MWEQNMPGVMTPELADQIHDAIDEFGVEAMCQGIKVAIARNKRHAGLKYVMACARREVEGIAPTSTEKKPEKKRIQYGAGVGLDSVEYVFDQLEKKHGNEQKAIDAKTSCIIQGSDTAGNRRRLS